MSAGPLSRISTSTQQTRSSESSQSSTGSASRYGLDDEDTRPILVYRWGGDISTTSQKALCHQLDHSVLATGQRPHRVTKKLIPRFAATVEVKRHDFYLPFERDLYRKYPNYDSSLASIRIPSNVYWSRALLGNFTELFMLSPETSPNGSAADSTESRHNSPWSAGSGKDADVGAEEE